MQSLSKEVMSSLRLGREEWDGEGRAIVHSLSTMCCMACGCVQWKSLITLCAFARFSGSSHESCASEKPFHLTRYCSFFQCPWHLDANTSSTSHSSCPAIRSGGGLVNVSP
jgi:hypothetical protein